MDFRRPRWDADVVEIFALQTEEREQNKAATMIAGLFERQTGNGYTCVLT